jgi:hypothetical protein
MSSEEAEEKKSGLDSILGDEFMDANSVSQS